MLPLPSDPSGKSDTALRYKQRNKSQQSDPLRLLFFFFCCKSLLQWEVHLLLSSCQVPPFTKRAQLPLGGRWYFYTVTVSGSEKAGCSSRLWRGTFQWREAQPFLSPESPVSQLILKTGTARRCGLFRRWCDVSYWKKTDADFVSMEKLKNP